MLRTGLASWFPGGERLAPRGGAGGLMVRNRYKGLCPHCRVWVMPSWGEVRKIDGRSVVAHRWCADLIWPKRTDNGMTEDGRVTGASQGGTGPCPPVTRRA
jgi:hypothetical protein